MSNSNLSSVERVEACPLSQWQVCHLNPRIGIRTEITVKQSLEQSIARQGMRGTVRLNEGNEKRFRPDIYLDCDARHLSIDCRHWTATASRHGRIYHSREFYQTQRGESTLDTYLKDGERSLVVAFELMMTDGRGHKERQVFFIPGLWLKQQFERSTEIGIDIDNLVELWPAFRKEGSRLYNIDLWKLFEIAENEEAWP